MKKFIFLFFIVFLWGCVEEPPVELFSIEAVCDSNGYVTPNKITATTSATVVFVVTANDDCIVSSVTANGKNITSSLNGNTLSLSNIKSDLKISFNIIKKVIPLKDFVITAYSGPNGSISPSGEITVKENTSQVFNMAPINIGFEMDVLKVNDVVVDTTRKYTFKNISSNNKIDVTWKKDSILYPLLNYTWYEVKYEALFSEGWYTFNNPYPWTFNFFQDGSGVELWNGKLYTDVTWSIDRSTSPVTFKLMGSNWKIEAISDKEIILLITDPLGQTVRSTFKSGPKITLKI